MHRPPTGTQSMQHHLSMPSHNGQGGYSGFGGPGGPGSHAMGMGGSSPIPQSSSPGSSYGPGGLPLPLNGQNTGNQNYGASPLAGSLSSGPPPNMFNNQRRESLSPFPQGSAAEMTPPFPTHSTSPALAGASLSRPGSSASKASPHKPEPTRVLPPSSLGSLPPPMFGGVKSVMSPPEMASDRSSSGPTPPIPSRSAGATGGPGSSVPIAMEGLAHQGQHMGPPSTLHDRVVFVSNVSRDSGGTLQSADISPELELTTVTAVYAMARTERFTEARGDDNPSRVSTEKVV